MQVSALESISPGFNSLSGGNPEEIASQIVEDAAEYYDEFCFHKEEKPAVAEGDPSKSELQNCRCVEEEFEFVIASGDSEHFPLISADEIFHNGIIRTVYKPSLGGSNGVESTKETAEKIGPLPRKLFIEEKEATTISSCSSSEADELDGIPTDTYCTWRPNKAEGGRWGKSSSIGSGSKSWKLKDILQRSHSVGSKGPLDDSLTKRTVGWKDRFVFSHHGNSSKTEDEKPKESPGKLIPPPCKRNDGEKRRSYLPYRQDRVGFIGNANGASKNFHPF